MATVNVYDKNDQWEYSREIDDSGVAHVYTRDAYEEGINEYKFYIDVVEDMDFNLRKEVFGDPSAIGVLSKLSFSEIKDKVAEYKRKKAEPKVGDVYECIVTPIKVVVVGVKGNSIEIMFSHFGIMYFNLQEFLTKYKPTGKNIELKLDSIVSELE